MAGKKRMRCGIAVVFILICICGICAVNALSYDLFGYKVRIKTAYFNEKEKLICSRKNPYRKEILSALEAISEKETIERTAYDSDTEFTIISTNNVKYEFFCSETIYPYPAMEGAATGYLDVYAYCVRVIKGKKEKTYYFNRRDEDIRKLRDLIDKAENFAYQGKR